MNDFITTYTKKHLMPLSPNKKDIDIRDIAHALSFMSRANGHFPQFYSVCQHSIHCCEEAIARDLTAKTAMCCLLHDGREAYIADITRPVKKLIPGYLEIEKTIQNAIYEKFAGSLPDKTEAKDVKDIDDALLYHEFMHFMGERTSDTVPFLKTRPEFKTIPFSEAEDRFIKLYEALYKKIIIEDCCLSVVNA